MAKVTTKDSTPIEHRVILSISQFAAPKTTQDAVDRQAAEFMVANLLRIHADKRYEAAKKAITESYDKEVAEIRKAATNTMIKTTWSVAGVDWSICLAANRPASRCDVDELRTELVRLGVKADLIDKAIDKVTKPSTPALLVSATRNAE